MFLIVDYFICRPGSVQTAEQVLFIKQFSKIYTELLHIFPENDVLESTLNSPAGSMDRLSELDSRSNNGSINRVPYGSHSRVSGTNSVRLSNDNSVSIRDSTRKQQETSIGRFVTNVVEKMSDMRSVRVAPSNEGSVGSPLSFKQRAVALDDTSSLTPSFPPKSIYECIQSQEFTLLADEVVTYKFKSKVVHWMISSIQLNMSTAHVEFIQDHSTLPMHPHITTLFVEVMIEQFKYRTLYKEKEDEDKIIDNKLTVASIEVTQEEPLTIASQLRKSIQQLFSTTKVTPISVNIPLTEQGEEEEEEEGKSIMRNVSVNKLVTAMNRLQLDANGGKWDEAWSDGYTENGVLWISPVERCLSMSLLLLTWLDTRSDAVLDHHVLDGILDVYNTMKASNDFSQSSSEFLLKTQSLIIVKQVLLNDILKLLRTWCYVNNAYYSHIKQLHTRDQEGFNANNVDNANGTHSNGNTVACSSSINLPHRDAGVDSMGCIRLNSNYSMYDHHKRIIILRFIISLMPHEFRLIAECILFK